MSDILDTEGWTKERFQAHLTETAEEASLDTEDVLSRLQQVKSEQANIKSMYESLRDEAVELLDGVPRYFLAEDGAKWYATVEQAEPLEVDEELLLGELADNEELLDEVMPRRVDKPAFKAAVQTQRISNETLLRVSRLKKNRPYIKFHYFDAE